MSSTIDQLHETIAAYNDAWNAHDVERIGALHAPDMVFENHTAGERAEGADALSHIAQIFESWPDIEFQTRRLYVREDLVVQEWTATATHVKPLSRGELVAEPSGKRIDVERHGRDPVRARQGQAQGRLLGFGVDPATGRTAVAGAGPAGVDQRPNQRARRLEPNCCFSATLAADGALKVPVREGPERKSMSTLPTRPAPNSM